MELSGAPSHGAVTEWERDDLAGAVAWLGRVLRIAVEHQMRLVAPVSNALARLLHQMGEEAFTSAWRQAFAGEAAPLSLLQAARERLET